MSLLPNSRFLNDINDDEHCHTQHHHNKLVYNKKQKKLPLLFLQFQTNFIKYISIRHFLHAIVWRTHPFTDIGRIINLQILNHLFFEKLWSFYFRTKRKKLTLAFREKGKNIRMLPYLCLSKNTYYDRFMFEWWRCLRIGTHRIN